jgi:arylsulfatase A-like enzyme
MLSFRRGVTVVLALLSALFLMPARAAQKDGAGQPNIIVLLADDEGYGELGFQGNREIPTPNIDSIAKNGIRFTNGYVSGPYCSPTRAGLMTGRYQTRFGHEFNGAGPTFGLPLSETTVAQRMKALGYATAAVGKWHLGDDMQFRPTKRGFDEFYGTLANTSFFRPRAFVDSRVSLEVQPPADPNFYTTDAYASRAVEWIEQHKARPFFLYLPFNAQHAPLQAPQKYLDRFPQITDEKRKIFAAMMAGKDEAVGQVLRKVRDAGLEEKTLIIYLTDNGGPTPVTTSKNDPLRGYKATTWEGGVRVPWCMQWKGRLPAGKVYEHPVIQLDLMPTFVTLAGGTVDPAWKLDGVDLMPYLTGRKTEKPHETLYWRFGAQWAIRKGDWKLVVARDTAGPALKAEGSEKPKLFNLAADVGEKKDLADTNPEKVKELQALWNAWNAEQKDPLWLPPGRPARAARL